MQTKKGLGEKGLPFVDKKYETVRPPSLVSQELYTKHKELSTRRKFKKGFPFGHSILTKHVSMVN